MRFTSTLLSIAVCGLVSALGSLAHSQDIATAKTMINGISVLEGEALNRKIAGVRPTVEEDRYRQIPWRTNLAEALKEAQSQKKPLFIWAMDGNPLCWT